MQYLGKICPDTYIPYAIWFCEWSPLFKTQQEMLEATKVDRNTQNVWENRNKDRNRGRQISLLEYAKD